MSSKARPASGTGGSRYEGIGGNGGSGAVSYEGVPSEELRDAIEGVSSEGDAVVFGRTSDGGAFSVRVLSDKQVFKWYPDSVEALRGVLHALSKQ